MYRFCILFENCDPLKKCVLTRVHYQKYVNAHPYCRLKGFDVARS